MQIDMGEKRPLLSFKLLSLEEYLFYWHQYFEGGGYTLCNPFHYVDYKQIRFRKPNIGGMDLLIRYKDLFASSTKLTIVRFINNILGKNPPILCLFYVKMVLISIL